MNQKRIDKIGVAAVVDYFCRMGHIDPLIAFDDKRAVWDGDIDIYKKCDSCSKEDIEFTLRVQVKSSECKSNSFNTYVTHSINIHDLELYKNNGGTLLIKVLISKNKAQLYFAYLGKVKINNLINDISEKQQTKDIRCYKAPKEYKELYSQLRTMYLQRIHNLITFDELRDKDGWSFNVTTGPIEKDANPLDWFATNYTDILVKLPGISEQFYLSAGPALLFTNQKVNKAVTVNGVEYFKEVNIGNNSKGHIISIDNFLIYQYNDFSQDKQNGTKIDVDITPSSKYVDEYLIQLRFLNAVFEHKYFNIGEVRLDAPLNNITEKERNTIKSEIRFFERTVTFFERLGLSSHFNFKDLNKEEFNNLVSLVKIFNGININKVLDFEVPISCFQIGEYNICLGTERLEDGGFSFYDINNCTSYRTCEQTGRTLTLPAYSYLFENDMFPDNLNYSDLVNEYKKHEINADFLMFANNDVLRLITKFDSTYNQKYLNAAKDLIEWIMVADVDENSSHIYRINLLQIYARLNKPFSNEDRQFLLNVDKYNSNKLNFAASVILKEESRAQSNYEKLTDVEKEEIAQFPIYNLYKNLIDNQYDKTENADC